MEQDRNVIFNFNSQIAIAKQEQVHVSWLLSFFPCCLLGTEFGRALAPSALHAASLWSEGICSPNNVDCFKGPTANLVFSKRHKIKSCISVVGPSEEERMLSVSFPLVRDIENSARKMGASHSSQKPAWSVS
jgi:hypothetical protein